MPILRITVKGYYACAQVEEILLKQLPLETKRGLDSAPLAERLSLQRETAIKLKLLVQKLIQYHKPFQPKFLIKVAERIKLQAEALSCWHAEQNIDPQCVLGRRSSFYGDKRFLGAFLKPVSDDTFRSVTEYYAKHCLLPLVRDSRKGFFTEVLQPSEQFSLFLTDVLCAGLSKSWEATRLKHPLAAYVCYDHKDTKSLPQKDMEKMKALKQSFDHLQEHEQQAFIWLLKNKIIGESRNLSSELREDTEYFMQGEITRDYLVARFALWNAAHQLSNLLPQSEMLEAVQFGTNDKDTDFIADIRFGTSLPVRTALMNNGLVQPSEELLLHGATLLLRDHLGEQYQRYCGSKILLQSGKASSVVDILLASCRRYESLSAPAFEVAGDEERTQNELQKFIYRHGISTVAQHLGARGDAVVKELLQTHDWGRINEQGCFPPHMIQKMLHTKEFVESVVRRDFESNDRDRWHRAAATLAYVASPMSSETILTLEKFCSRVSPDECASLLEPIVERHTSLGHNNVQGLAIAVVDHLSVINGYLSHGKIDAPALVANILGSRGIPEDRVLLSLVRLTGHSEGDLRGTFSLLLKASENTLKNIRKIGENNGTSDNRWTSLFTRVAGLVAAGKNIELVALVNFLSDFGYRFEEEHCLFLETLLRDKTELEITREAFLRVAGTSLVAKYQLPDMSRDRRRVGAKEMAPSDIEFHMAARPVTARFFASPLEDQKSSLGWIKALVQDDGISFQEATAAYLWYACYKLGINDGAAAPGKDLFLTRQLSGLMSLLHAQGRELNDHVYTDLLKEMVIEPQKAENILTNLGTHGGALLNKFRAAKELESKHVTKWSIESSELHLATLSPRFYVRLVNTVHPITAVYFIDQIRTDAPVKCIERLIAEPQRTSYLFGDEILFTWLKESSSYEAKYVAHIAAMDTPLSREDMRSLPDHTRLIDFVTRSAAEGRSVRDKIVKDQYPSFQALKVELYNAMRASLSRQIPEKYVTAADPVRLLNFAMPFLTIMERVRGDSALPLHLLGIADLTGRQNLLWQGDETTIDSLVTEVASLEGMNGGSRELEKYKNERLCSDKAHPFLSLLSEAQRKVWNAIPRPVDQIIGETTIEDRLLSVRSIVRGCFDSDHISKETRELIGLGRSVNELSLLAQQWKLLLSRKDEPAVCERLEIQRRQQELKKWQDVVVLSRAADKIDEVLDRLAELRKALSLHASFISELGFDFNDSFGSKIFKGELGILVDRLKQYKDTPHAAEVVSITEDITRITQGADGVLGEVAKRAALAAKSLLTYHRDEQAVVDCNAIYSVVMGKDADPSILFYKVSRSFSSDLKGTVGQCLDYRTGINAKHNVAWGDGIADMVVAHDIHGTPRVNALLYGVGLKKRMAQLPAIVLDTPYTSDGTPLTWDKIEGLIKIAAQRALALKLPLIVPKNSTVGYSEDTMRVLKTISSAHDAVRSRSVTMVVAPGVSGSLYIEAKGFNYYTGQEALTLDAVVMDVTGAASDR